MTSILSIEGLLVTELRQISDERGAILHMLRSDAPEFVSFGECYFSEILPGAIKAWKRHRKQTQNISVPVGRVRLVAYDDRDESSTKGKLQLFELGRPDAYLRLKIPPSIWYGFMCVGSVPALIANCTDFPHDPTENESRPIDDAAIPYQWITGSEEAL